MKLNNTMYVKYVQITRGINLYLYNVFGKSIKIVMLCMFYVWHYNNKCITRYSSFRDVGAIVKPHSSIQCVLAFKCARTY